MKAIRKRMNKKGFTLVELIIVIAVMAILAAIVVPNFGNITQTFRLRADQRSAEGIAKELQLAITMGETVNGLADDGTDTDLDVSMIEGTVLPTLSSDSDARYVVSYNETSGVLTVKGVDDSDNDIANISATINGVFPTN